MYLTVAVMLLYHRSYHLWPASHLVQQRPSLPGKNYGDNNIKVTF